MVNVTDFKEPEIKGDKLDAIFERQKELMHKYHVIEAASGLLQTYDVPVDLDDAKGQARIKDFAWRCTEELMEAIDAYLHKVHFEEEIADAFHFLVELVILAGYSSEDIAGDLKHLNRKFKRWEGDGLDLLFRSCPMDGTIAIRSAIIDFLVSLGMLCHTLKNKPWVQTQRVTDRKEFKIKLVYTFQEFIKICIGAEINAQDLFSLYFRKSDVNKFRQRSNY